MKLEHITDPSFEVMEKIVELEQQAFEGAGNVDLWIIKALIRYGLVFVVKEGDKIISIIEYMQKFNNKSVFLYGISTLKEYRFKGYASYLIEESEKYLKEHGFEEIELTVAPDNDIAINLYTKYDYKKIKYLKDEYGKGIDRYTMIKTLK